MLLSNSSMTEKKTDIYVVEERGGTVTLIGVTRLAGRHHAWQVSEK